MDTNFDLRINIGEDAIARQLPTASKGTTITIILKHECVSMTENGIIQVHLSAKVRNFQGTLFYKLAFYVVEIKCSNIPTIENGHFIFSNKSKNEYYDEEKIEWKCDKGFSHVEDFYGRRPFPFSPFPFDSRRNECHITTIFLLLYNGVFQDRALTTSSGVWHRE